MAKKTYYRYDKDTGELDFYFGDDFQETPSAGIPLQAAQKFYKNRNLQNFDYQSRDTSGVSNQEVADRSYYGIQRYRPNNKQSGRYSSYRDEDSGTSTTRRSQQKRDTATKLSEFADWAKQLRQSENVNTREAAKKSTEYRDYLEKNKGSIDSATLAQAKRLLDYADKEISVREQKGLDERRSGTPVNGNRSYKGVNQYTSEFDLIKNVQQQSNIMEQARERQRQQEQEEYDRKTAEYEDLLNRRDFALNSLYKKSDNPMLAENALYEYVNNNADVRRLAEDYGYTGRGNTGFSIDNDKTYIENMSPNEIRTFNYLDATEGREAAEEYLQHIRPQLTERQRTERTDIFEKEAEKDPVASSVASVLMKPFSAFSYAGQAADLIANGSIDQNAAYNQYSYVPTAIRDKVSKKVEEKFGRVGSFAYQTGMSMADFLYLGGMTGGLGAVGEPLMLGIMGSGAAADKVIEAKDDGLDDGQAFALGTIAGAAEYITEKISVDTLLNNIPKLGKNFAGYFAKNFLAEGSEEVASDLINTVADVAIAKDKSAWRKSIQEYMNQGYSEKEAFARAMADQAKQMGLSFVGGALSGGLMAGGVGAYSIASNVGRSVNEQLNESTVNYDNALADGATRSQISEAQTEVARKKEALKKAMDESNDVDTAFRQGIENYTESQDLTTDSTADEVVRETAEPASIRLSEENADMDESEASVIPAEETPAKSQSQLDWEASVDAMSTMGENGKEALKELGSVMDANDLADAQSEFTLGYEAGRSAQGRNALPRQSFLTEIGYRAGVNDGVSASTERIAAAREAVTPTVQNKLAAYAPTQAGIANTAEELQAYKEVYNPATGQPRLTNEHINKWNTAAKLLGVRVRFADHLEQNAYIDDNGEVVVAMDADIDNTMDFYLGHEFTHRLQQASPQHYNALVSAVRSSMSPEAWAQAVSDYQSLAKKHGVELSESGAVDEIVADHIGKLLDKDGTALDDFIRQHVGTREGRTLIQKVRDFIRSISRKLHGNEISKRYSEVEKRLSEALQASYEEVQKALDQRQETREQTIQSEAEELSDVNLKYSVRTEDPPKKTGVAYKVFMAKNGQLYPPMVANPGGEGTPIGVWLNADAAPMAGLSVTGRPQVQAGGKGTNVSKQTLAYRPGWHLGDIPLATQFAKKNPSTGKKELFPANFVWAECEYAMDVDYQKESDEMGYMRTNPDGTYYKSDKYQHALAGLKKLPKDGYYRYRTNPRPDTVPWVITGAMKVNRILDDNEVAEICKKNGVEPLQRQGGPINLAKYGLENKTVQFSIRPETKEQIENLGAAVTGDAVTKHSLRTWNETDKKKLKAKLLEAGFEEEEVDRWINDVNGVAAWIAEDMERLDYEASPVHKFLKANGDYYKKTLDASTLCKKRLLYQGTYNAIQHAMKNTPLLPDDVIMLRDIMAKLGYEAPCGICYVESQRKMLGKYAADWLETYKGDYIPKLDDVTTTDGLERLRVAHPQPYKDFTKAMKKKGVQSPKVVELRTEYRRDLSRMTKRTVNYLNKIGGLRINSFSDFETVHIIDFMQAVMDMSSKGLYGMAYTKVPAFAKIFGSTGIKINLSLIPKIDDNGNIMRDKQGRPMFDNVEGMDIDEALAIRDMYPDNVATIVVGKDMAHVLEMLDDDRIDYVIPFHRSKWTNAEFEKLGLKGYEDFATGHQSSEVFPSEYWVGSKSGKENAERYLEICKERGATPVFEQLLKDNGDGSYSLKDDGSTDNYWKLLIEGKMYNHLTGEAAPQQVVRPDFNMEAAKETMDSYDGDPNSLPVASEAVKEFIKYKKEQQKQFSEMEKAGKPFAEELKKRKQYSFRQSDAEYMDAVNRGDMETAQRMVDEAAKAAGYTIRAYHGTARGDRVGTVFLPERATSGPMAYFTSDSNIAENYAKDKADTSLAYQKEYDSYYTQFRIQDKAVGELWNELSASEKARIREAGKHITWDEDMENIIYDEDADRGIGNFDEYTLREHKGNAIEALVDSWLESGELFNQERDFLKVLELAGINDAEYLDPEERHEKVYETYLKIQNPFITTDMYNSEFVDGLERWWGEQDRKRYVKETANADAWDKNNISVEDWIDKARHDLENGNSHAFTTIPDAVTDYIKSLGYDGIFDQGGKNGGSEHTVYIPFSSEQIKSSDPVTYDDNGNVIPLSERFNERNEDIRYSIRKDSEGRELTEEQQEFFKDSKILDEKGNLLVVYHGTDAKGFTVFDKNRPAVNGRVLGNGFYFARAKNYAYDWGSRNVYEAYLNVKNPFVISEDTSVPAELIEAIEQNAEGKKDYIIEKAKSSTYMFLVFVEDVFGETDISTILKEYGYDGIISKGYTKYYNEYVAFEPNQIKLTTNQNPTENEDIRYSFRGSENILDHAETVADTANLYKQVEKLQRQGDELKGEFQQNKGYKASVPASNKSVKDLLARYGVDAHRAGIEIAKTGDDFRKWANQLARNPQESYTAVRAEATKLAYKLMWNSQELIDTGTMVDDAQKLLKEQTIYIDPRIKSDIADFDLLRKEYKGRLNFTYAKGKGRAVDELYQELNTIYPWLFPEDIVNSSDQMEQIFSAADAMAYISYNPYSEYDADTVDMVTNDILNELLGMLGVKNPDSYRDKMEKRIERVKAERDEKLARVEQHYREQKEKAKLRRASSEARENLLKIARRLEKMKTTGANRALIEQALGDLDTTARKISGKTLTNLAALRSWVNEQKNVNQDFIIDQNTRNKLERLEKIQHQIEEAGQTLEDVLASGKGWDQFDSIDIMLELTDVLKALETQIRNENRTIDTEDRHDVFIQGDESIEAIENSYGNNTSFAEFMDKYLFTESARPSTEMLRICGYNENVPFYQRFLDLTKGQQNMVDYHRRANVRYFDKFTHDKEFIREVTGKHAREIEITGIDQHGKTVTVKVTPDLLMSMYMHSMNDQNTRHVSEGGMRVPDVKLYKDGKIAKAYEKGTLVKMTRTAMRSVAMSNLTQKERAFITAAQQYYSQMSQPEINAVSEKLVGYEIAKVDNYYRIVTDKNWMKTNLDEMKYDGTIEGMGFTKERIAEAKNPIQLIGMISQITTDIDMHSKYVGMAIPVRNFNKVYGVTAKSFDKNGDIKSHYDRSVMDTIQSKWGDKANQYIVKMMSDLQNPKRSTDTAFGPVLSKLRSNYAQAVLTLNASVAIKQSASYPTAAAELGWKPLMQALMTANKTKGKDAAWIAQYSPLMRLRAEGYVSQETGDILAEGKRIPTALNWIQKFDIGTVRLLWLASEYSVKETNPELKPGTKEFYEKVGEVHTRVIENTQPNYTSLQRAQILRSDNELVRMLNMFKTQPFQNFNILMEAFGNNRAKSIAYKNNPTEENLRNLKMARRKLGRAVSSQLVASFVFAGMSMLWELFRGKREKYEDEEGKLNWGAWGKAMGLSMISNLGGMLPFGSTFIEAAESTSDKIAKAFGKEAFFDQKFYGLDSGMSVEAINNIITDGSDLVATLIESANALFNSAEAGSKIDWEAVLRDAKDAASGISQMFGVPFDNLFNTSMAMVGDSVKLSDGYFLGKYTQMRLEKGITSFNKNAYANILIQAYKTDRKQYEKLYDIMVNEPGFSSDSKTSEEWVQDKMGALLQQEDRLNNGITDEMWEQYNSIVEKDEKTGKPKRTKEAVYEALLQMDLTKEQRAFLFATQTGDSGTSIDAYGEKWNKQHDKEVARSEAGITQAIYDDYLAKKKPYGSLSQDEFDEVVTSMNLNAEQTEALWKELWPKSTYAEYLQKPKKK